MLYVYKIYIYWKYVEILSFQYLGCIEVFESRGMQVCEDAVKALKAVSIGFKFLFKWRHIWRMQAITCSLFWWIFFLLNCLGVPNCFCPAWFHVESTHLAMFAMSFLFKSKNGVKIKQNRKRSASVIPDFSYIYKCIFWLIQDCKNQFAMSENDEGEKALAVLVKLALI